MLLSKLLKLVTDQLQPIVQSARTLLPEDCYKFEFGSMYMDPPGKDYKGFSVTRTVLGPVGATKAVLVLTEENDLVFEVHWRDRPKMAYRTPVDQVPADSVAALIRKALAPEQAS
jgi:hypothetical protein